MNVGIIGAGLIVPEFLEASKGIDDFIPYSICGTTNDLEIMTKLKEKYALTNVFTEYQKLLEDNVDVIYVAVPNHLHYQFAKEALQNKKHVLLEKPFASNLEQAQELVTLAKENNVIIFEAISNQYLPNYMKTKELLKDLGDIKIVQLNYSQYSRRYDMFKEGTILPVFDPKKSGGALMDLNVYNIHFIVGLFGKPEKVNYIANIEQGIDTSGIMTLEYPSFKCVAIAAKDCQSPVSITLQGDKGNIYSPYPSNVYETFVFSKNSGDGQTYILNDGKSRLYFEIEYFKNIVQNNDYDKAKQLNQHSLVVMKILDEGRKQVGIKI